MKLKGSEIIARACSEREFEVLFGHPGGAILPFYDALWAYPQLRHILVRHEQSAAHAADGYARMTGKPGVCVATSAGRHQLDHRNHEPPRQTVSP